MPPKRKSARQQQKKEEEEEVEYNEDELKKLTVAKLKEICQEKNLDEKGTKATIIARILGGGNEDEEDEGPLPKVQKKSTIQKAIDAMAKEVKRDAKKKKVHKVDQYFTISGCEVLDDYDAMLNQTNIGHNNNKYYVVQVLCNGSYYYSWTRWGRVGESGASMIVYQGADQNAAIKAFKKKFHDKTKNDWEKRDKFKAVPGKYTMIDVGVDEDEQTTTVASLSASPKKYAPSKLDKPTRELIQMIFDNDMFKEAMMEMEIDVKKMPLGKLSKAQIVKGFQVLDQIKSVIEKKSKGNLTELSSQFYTVIPHDFGRQRPPVINDQDALRKKLDMLLTLSDIELAQGLLKEKEEKEQKAAKKAAELDPDPMDKNYEMLNCKLELVKPGSNDYKVIEKYFESTAKGGWWRAAKKIINVWRMDREEEKKRFATHKTISNRRLLWHGTKVAVVAAIMKSGLRIMPHSGGRVGRGIYFASECSKSAGYVGPCKNIGVMFLNEVVIGKPKEITRDDSSLTKAPAGFNSVIAMGTQEPDECEDVELNLEGNKVKVPQGSPKKRNITSTFDQSEYLVYQESQVRMRYLLTIEF